MPRQQEVFRSLETNVVHAGGPRPRVGGAVVTPVFQSANYLMADETNYGDVRYIRLHNSPNHRTLHARLAAIESGEAAMSKLAIRLLDRSRCRAVQVSTGAELITDMALELGGGGTSFSSTDLLGAALGTCIGSSLAPMIQRAGIELKRVEISVDKRLGTRPKRIDRLSVEVRISAPATARQLRRFRSAARSCLVHRSLVSDLDVRIEVSALGATDTT